MHINHSAEANEWGRVSYDSKGSLVEINRVWIISYWSGFASDFFSFSIWGYFFSFTLQLFFMEDKKKVNEQLCLMH